MDEKMKSRNDQIFTVKMEKLTNDSYLLDLLSKEEDMLTEQEKQKLGKDIALIIVTIGGILTLSYAIYFIVDTLKKWY